MAGASGWGKGKEGGPGLGGFAARSCAGVACCRSPRSVGLRQMAPLAAIPDVTFVSLQKGEAAGQACPPEMTLLDFTDELTDFEDTAALVAALDLVISVDTAVVHLAGGLGVPVWVLNRFDTCWRWLLGRSDSLWYRSVTLFRQPAPGDWDRVMQEAAAALGGIHGQAV